MFQDCDFFTPNYVQQGWQCPICKRVYAPDIAQCFYCGNQTVITSDKVCVVKDDSDPSDIYTWYGTVPECGTRRIDSWSGTVPEARRGL